MPQQKSDGSRRFIWTISKLCSDASGWLCRLTSNSLSQRCYSWSAARFIQGDLSSIVRTAGACINERHTEPILISDTALGCTAQVPDRRRRSSWPGFYHESRTRASPHASMGNRGERRGSAHIDERVAIAESLGSIQKTMDLGCEQEVQFLRFPI